MALWKPTNGIKWHRLRLGLTQKELALQVGVTQKYIPQWERWQRTPTPDQQARLVEVLECQLDEPLKKIDGRLEMEVDPNKMLKLAEKRSPRYRWTNVQRGESD